MDQREHHPNAFPPSRERERERDGERGRSSESEVSVMSTMEGGGGGWGEGGDGVALKKKGSRKLSPYFSFSKQNRERVKAQIVAAGGKPSASAISKALGELWRSLSDVERAAFSKETPLDDNSLPTDDIRIRDGGEASGISDSSAKIQLADADLLQPKIAVETDLVEKTVPDNEHICEEGDIAAENAIGEAPPPFPLARIKRIIRLDKDIKLLSSDGVLAITRATQLFLETLASASYSSMLKSKRKSIRLPDVEMAIKSNKRIHEFIGDSLSSVSNDTHKAENNGESSEEQEEEEDAGEDDGHRSKKARAEKKAIPAPPPPGSRSITDFFGSKPNKALVSEATIEVL
ncbi:hypothetical protein O6H91_01G162000 [Diphasiastrum complanatum]|uniref:Uncharacterized protein n=2 Tax=Diphasiastrum complanatum TaxID=34168 RepID=A0ACC2EY75_DIPCM|nr:hypothetical protein O6H91_01G162000 [Diphasiastrum complanatum]